jgi:hypothetical protein
MSRRGPDERDQDLRDEIESHLAMAAADRVRRGESDAEARYAARREFGNVGEVMEVTRDVWGWSALRFLLRDARDAWRALRGTPRVTALVAGTLAMGIGSATAMYAVVDGVLLRPLPYSNQDRLVAVRDWQPRGVETNVAFPEFDDWRRLAPPSVAGVAAWFNTSMAVTGDGEPEILRGERMSANLPALLGVTPLRGRSFLPDEERSSVITSSSPRPKI